MDRIEKALREVAIRTLMKEGAPRAEATTLVDLLLQEIRELPDDAPMYEHSIPLSTVIECNQEIEEELRRQSEDN
jgi:hypothetical protein